MTQSFNERMGVMKNLVEQNTDRCNKLSTAIAEDCRVQSTTAKQDRAGQVDQISGQIQALNDTMDELKVRHDKVCASSWKTCSRRNSSTAVRSHRRNNRPQAHRTGATARCALQQRAPRLQRRQADLAVAGISDYIKFYPNTDLAGNAYFYLAESQFTPGNYPEAVEEYDLVLQNILPAEIKPQRRN